jgi:predicted DsbA family dithiol-disulfide isomerase
MAAAGSSGPELDVFADVSCPFTHVALRRLVERRASKGAGTVTLHVRAWPLELVNGGPTEPDTLAEEVDALRAQVAPDLFTGFDAARPPSTSIPALALAAAAYRVGTAVGERFSLALRDALFERAQDIADPDVLAALAAQVGLAPVPADPEQVIAEWHDGQARGVKGSPHFFGPGLDAFCPTLAVDRVDGHLRIRADPGALDSFL